MALEVEYAAGSGLRACGSYRKLKPGSLVEIRVDWARSGGMVGEMSVGRDQDGENGK